MGIFDNITGGGIQAAAEIERNPWENLMVSMERSFYNIVDLAGTSVRKLSAIALEEDDPRKEAGIGWIGRNAGRIALTAGWATQDPGLAPETDPELMDKFTELLGTTIPYTAAAIGGAVIGGAGATAAGLAAGGIKLTAAAAAGLTSFSIMREEAYRGAIGTGATEKEANIEANIVGGINALLELANLGTILRGTRTGGVILKSIALNARNKAWSQVLKEGGKFTMTMVRSATEEAIQEALQGTTSEIVPRMLRGVEIEPGFWGRRGGEALGGAVIGTLFSGLGSMGAAALQKGEARAPQLQEIEDLDLEGPQAEPEELIDPETVRNELEETLGREATPDEVNEEIGRRTATIEQKADAINEGQEIDPSSRGDVAAPVTRFSKLMENLDLKEVRKLTETQRHRERGRRVAVAQKVKEEIFEKTQNIDEANKVSKSMMAGEMPSASFEGFSDEQFSQADWRALRVEIFQSDLLYYEQEHATMATHKLEQGMVPTPSEMRTLSRVMGLKTQEVLVGIAELGEKKLPLALRILMEISTASITAKTTMDVSLVGRQGLVTAVRFPKQWGKAFVVSHKAFWNTTKNAKAALNEMATQKNAPFRRQYGLAEHTIDGPTATQHELFQAQWLKKIPYFGAVVRASERAAAVGMNTLRNQIFDSTVERWEGQNRTDQDYQELADLCNNSTGVGTGKFMKNYGRLLNAPFFSFGYNYSRFQLLGKGIKALADISVPQVGGLRQAMGMRESMGPASKILAGELVLFVMGGLTAMLMSEALGAKVEKDPRSSDFGKIVMGKMRIDVWAGFQQIATMVCQLASGEGKSLRTGEIYTKERLTTVARYVQGKLSPIAGLGVELLSKKTFLGENLPDRVKTPEGAIGYALNKIAPLVLEDTIDAIRFQGLGAGLTAFPLAFHGIGVSTYEPSPLDHLTDMRDHYSQKMFGNNWDNLGPSFQEALEDFYPQIQEQERVAKFERRNAEFNAARQREAGRAVEKALPKNVQREMDNLGVTVGGLSRTLNRGWRLNGELYKKYQTDLSSLLTKILPKLMGMSGYDSLPYEIKVGVMEEALREIKLAVRKDIIMQAEMRDLEKIL